MADDDDIAVTGETGFNAMRNAPHSHHTCLEHRFDKAASLEEARKACAMCYCWVCDDEVKKCKKWDAHCKCDGGTDWIIEKNKMKREKSAEAERKKAVMYGQAPAAVPSAADVADRFRQGGQGEDNLAMSAKEEEARQEREQVAENEEDEDLFADYEPRLWAHGQPHPDQVVETTSLSFAELPPINYTLKLPKGILEPKSKSNEFGGTLSRLQLETVAYASQRHQMMLTTGYRAGFFLGDGVGLGKGRQLAGMILEGWSVGRKRHVWVSVSADLMVDAMRDLNDIGATQIADKVFNITKAPQGKLKQKEGVIYSTYSALVQDRRLKQIVDWLGADNAEGCILFDESHKAKNLFPDAELQKAAEEDPGLYQGAVKRGRTAGKKKSTKMAQAVQRIQDECPKARVVYCSATGASSIGNMGYMSRLGLWGPGTAFSSFSEFEKSLGSGGVGAMELIALDMKRRGMYISRQLSFKSAEFETMIIDLRQRQQKMYDNASKFWTEMFGCFAFAMDKLGVKNHPARSKTNPHPSGRCMSHYWGCHQRFFRQLCMAMKVPRVVELAKKALAEDKCIVIGLQTTGEARLDEAVKSGKDLDEFAGMKEVVLFLISKFPLGDYTNRYPDTTKKEEVSRGANSSDDDEDSDEDLVGKAAAEHQANERETKGRGGRKTTSGGRRGMDDSDGEDSDDDLDGFIVDDDVEESDDEMDEDGLERAPRNKLPNEIVELSKEDLRTLLNAAKIPHQQCTNKGQLLARVKQVEARAAAGSGPTAMSLLQTLGLGQKQTCASPERAASSARAPQRGRPTRKAASVARSNYIEILDSDKDEETASDSMELSETESEKASRGGKSGKANGKGKGTTGKADAAASSGGVNGLVGRQIRLLRETEGKQCIATVIAHDAGSQRHTVKYEDGKTARVDLLRTRYSFVMASAPGGRPKSGVGVGVGTGVGGRKRRKAVVSDSADEDGSDDEWEPENDPPQARRASSSSSGGMSAKMRGKRPVRRSYVDQDDDDDDEDEDEDDAEVGEDDDDDDQRDVADLAVFNHDNVAEIRQLQALKRGLLAKLNKLKMPENPLDELVHQLGGPSSVAEMTGRKGRLVRNANDKTVYSKRNEGETNESGNRVSMEKINLHERENFMQGRKLVAIISEAASSGISLQADRRVGNQRRRVHITLELPWSADQAIQQCGRTHRSNQIHGPQYRLMMTACGGERRFASTVAKRLQALGALTKGDRRAADAADLSAFDVDTQWGRRALNKLLEVVLNPALARQTPPPKHVREALNLPRGAELQQRWDDYLDEAEEACFGAGMDPDKTAVKGMLNRLLGMPVSMQNKIFAHFTANLDYEVKTAKDENRYDDGVVDIRGQDVHIMSGFPATLGSDQLSGVGLQHFKLGIDRGVSHARALEQLEKKKGENGNDALFPAEGIYESTKPLIGREKEGLKSFAMLLQRPIPPFALNPVPLFKVIRPGTGLGKVVSLKEFEGEGGLFPKRFNSVDAEDAFKGWNRMYQDADKYCSHGPNCKNGRACQVGRRVQTENVLTGSVLPFWDKIQQAVGWKDVGNSDRTMKRVSRMQIVRVRVDAKDGKPEQRIVGVKLAEEHLRKLQHLLNVDTSSNDVKPDIKPDIKPYGKGKGGGGSSSHGGGGSAYGGGPSSYSGSASSGGASRGGKLFVKGAIGFVVSGLVGAPHFNGSVVQLNEWDDSAPGEASSGQFNGTSYSGRWDVKITSKGIYHGQMIKVLPSKLKRL